MFCGVNDLVGGMSDTCGGNGVTLSAGGWDSVRRGCEAVAGVASGSLVGAVRSATPVSDLWAAWKWHQRVKWTPKPPQVRGERDFAAVGPVEDFVAAVDGMGMTAISGCLLSCADMSVGGLSDSMAGGGAALRDGAGGLLWTALDGFPRSGAAMPGAPVNFPPSGWAIGASSVSRRLVWPAGVFC